jgi:hypothetical protein
MASQVTFLPNQRALAESTDSWKKRAEALEEQLRNNGIEPTAKAAAPTITRTTTHPTPYLTVTMIKGAPLSPQAMAYASAIAHRKLARGLIDKLPAQLSPQKQIAPAEQVAERASVAVKPRQVTEEAEADEAKLRFAMIELT